MQPQRCQPLVMVYRDPKKMDDETIFQLRDLLQESVSKHLSGEGELFLVPNDVSVIFHDFGRYDVSRRPLQVHVFASHCQDYAADPTRISQEIADDIHKSWLTGSRYMTISFGSFLAAEDIGFIQRFRHTKIAPKGRGL